MGPEQSIVARLWRGFNLGGPKPCYFDWAMGGLAAGHDASVDH
jgi:hypothetical protein